MTYSIVVTEDLRLIITDSNGLVIEDSGPWYNSEDATNWANRYVDQLIAMTSPPAEPAPAVII